MPGFDGTGPEGKGPATGGGQGFCREDFSTGQGLRQRRFYRANPFFRLFSYGLGLALRQRRRNGWRK